MVSAVAGAHADDKADVLAANEAFELAFATLDMKTFEPLWLQDASVTAIHPISKEVLVGWDAVRKSWAEGVFTRYSEITVTTENPTIVVTGDTAKVVGIEKVSGTRKNGEKAEFSALTTHIWVKRDGKWLLSHHHASRMPQ